MQSLKKIHAWAQMQDPLFLKAWGLIVLNVEFIILILKEFEIQVSQVWSSLVPYFREE